MIKFQFHCLTQKYHQITRILLTHDLWYINFHFVRYRTYESDIISQMNLLNDVADFV